MSHDSILEARRLLQLHFGYPEFRPAQFAVIDSVLSGRDTLAILPTGGGKSICFQIPALVLGGLTVVVSPLISLMQDQVDSAQARGLPAACLNSSLSAAAQREVRERVAAGTLRLVYVSPERLDQLSQELRTRGIKPRLLVVDEAHCVAEWGHDFRPSYRKLGRIRYRLGSPQAVALTGSATAEVRSDIARTLRLRNGYALHLDSFDRRNLWFGAVQVSSERERLEALLQLLRGDDVMALVYAPTRGSTERIACRLSQAGHRATPYHAGLCKAHRRAALDAFLHDRVDVLVATCAFGMGIDKPNVRLVVHWAPPPTPEAYYQEAGRAGRDGAFARCVMLWREGDVSLHRRQLDVTFPARGLLDRIWKHPSGTAGIPENVLGSAERLRRELRPERGPVDWKPVLERRLRAEARIAAVAAYARQGGCRRAHLLEYFGEKLCECAGCDHCGERQQHRRVAPEISARIARLRQALSRKKSPCGGCPLEPEVLLRLAEHPPADGGALADVPGVGPAIAERLGGTILTALGVSPSSPGPSNQSPLYLALESWRASVARQMGVPDFTVLPDVTLDTIVRQLPQTRDELARIPGIGPRTLGKFGDVLLKILWRASPRAPIGISLG